MAVNQKPPACDKCPARSCGLGFVGPEIPEIGGPQACVVGQGPGKEEVEHGRPFYPEAPSGFLLNKWLNHAGILRSKLLISNVIWCWIPKGYKAGQPYGSRTPTQEEMAYCYAHNLYPLLVEHGFDAPGALIFTLGDPATQFFLGLEKVGRYRGTANERALPLPDMG